MNIKKTRILSSFIIVFMLITIGIYLGRSNYQYTFNYNNNDVIYNGNKDSNKISLMINVYWGTEYIEDILDILYAYNVKCTFFVGGSWAVKEQELLKTIHNQGHEIGNHGYFHKDGEKLNYQLNYDEINVNHELINSILGIEMNLFAPPSGSFNKSTISACMDLGYRVIMWSKDTIDWRDKDSNLIFERATKNVCGGDLILMHPTENTLKALPLILEYYKINNIFPTTVSDCIK